MMPTTTVFLEITPSKAIERLKRRGLLAPNETESRLAEIRTEYNSLLRPHNRQRSDLSVVPVCADNDIEEIVVQVANVVAAASKKE
jgi:thymidylate kinase